MAKINRKIVLFYCSVAVFILGFAYVVDPVNIMHSAQTMTQEAATQHERIMSDRYKKPLVTIIKHPKARTQIKLEKKPNSR